MARKRASARWKRHLQNTPIKAPLADDFLVKFEYGQVNQPEFLSYHEVITIYLAAALRRARASAPAPPHLHLVPLLCGQSIPSGLHYHTLH